jgi:hypothetical protein
LLGWGLLVLGTGVIEDVILLTLTLLVLVIIEIVFIVIFEVISKVVVDK